jgi:hypothetical protein
MQQYSLDNCPSDIRAQLDTLVNGLRDALDGDLLSVLLHGSLAMGCFNRDTSDLDVLVITADDVSLAQKDALAAVLLACSAQPAPVEISVMHTGQLQPFIHPAPFEFHFGESWRARFAAGGEVPQPASDPDLAVHIAVARARGRALLGRAPTEILPQLPRATVLDAILQDTLSADYGVADLNNVENPSNAILNACRMFAFLREDRLLSKDEGALWASINLPWRYASLAARALEQYRSGRVPVYDPAELTRLGAYVQGELRLART